LCVIYLVFSLNVSSLNETKLIDDNDAAATLAIDNDAAATLAIVIQKDTNIEDNGYLIAVFGMEGAFNILKGIDPAKATTYYKHTYLKDINARVYPWFFKNLANLRSEYMKVFVNYHASGQQEQKKLTWNSRSFAEVMKTSDN
jgi:hypothetical protein